MGSLETYRAKRDFTKTSEPSGDAPGKASAKASASQAGGVFIIHKHDATRLHYDLRLEHDGVLWSWAVTRGPSLDPSEKRLAVHVEDHPLDYGSFEGVIPEGEYGAGAVIVWDEGTWVPSIAPDAGMKKGHLAFTLEGHKLRGAWNLVRLKPRRGEKRDNWLLIKVEDEAAKASGDILEDQPDSVASGRSIEDVAAGKPGRTEASKAAKTKARPESQAAPKKAKTKTKAGKAPMPEFIAPALATLQSTPPAGADWLHEVKFDGYRLQARIADGAVSLLTRKGLDWTAKFTGPVTEALEGLDCENAILDGEVVVLGDHGVTSFPALQNALSEGAPERMIYYAFDLLHLDGEDLRDQPQLTRKERLEDLLGEAGQGEGALRYSEHFVEAGKTMLAHACRLGLEGVVSKNAGAVHHSGRTLDWIKSKCTNRQEFVIVGYVPSTATGRGLRSLLVAYNENGKLRYGGRVGTGFSVPVAHDLKAKLDAIRAKRPPFPKAPLGQKAAIWVEPKLVAEVEFRAWTEDGILRHASFQGLREDKPSSEVVAEAPDDPKGEDTEAGTPKSGAKAAADKSRRTAKATQTSVTLTNPDKMLWPQAGVSKRVLLDHYALVWPRMQRFVANRPLSLVRAPDGIDGQRFFQKHASKGMPAAIRTMMDPVDGEEILYIDDFDGLAALVQIGVVEVHIWGSTIDTIDQPDQFVFDLDPDEGLGVEAVRDAAQAIRERLDDLGLQSVLKTSGGKGFHVVVPIKPKANWTDVKAFSHDFAKAMAQAEPDRYTATLSKKGAYGAHLHRLSAQRPRLNDRGTLLGAREAGCDRVGSDPLGGLAQSRAGRLRHR